VDHQLFFREKLQRTIAFHIDGVSKVAVLGRKYRNNDAVFMVVGRFVDPLADRKFGHPRTPYGIVGAIIRPKWLTDLKHKRRELVLPVSASGQAPMEVEARPMLETERGRKVAQLSGQNKEQRQAGLLRTVAWPARDNSLNPLDLCQQFAGLP
jgi:hypothetical protein